jgi:hypothetical protein
MTVPLSHDPAIPETHEAPSPAAAAAQAPPASRSSGAERLRRILDGAGVPCEVRLASGEVVRCGDGPPRFRATFHSDRVLRRAFDEMALGQAYVEGEIDL